MSNDLTLTNRQRGAMSAITNEWKFFRGSPEHPIIKQLEKRGLIELRIAPDVTPKEAMTETLLGSHKHWQVRRKPTN